MKLKNFLGAVVGGVIGFFAGGGPWGAVQGAAIGYSLTMKPKKPKVEALKKELNLQQESAYGSTIPIVYGPYNKVKGFVFQLSAPKFQQLNVNGKKIDATLVSFSVAINDRQSFGFRRIWFNDVLVCDVASNSALTGTLINSSGVPGGIGALFDRKGGWPTEWFFGSIPAGHWIHIDSFGSSIGDFGKYTMDSVSFYNGADGQYFGNGPIVDGQRVNYHGTTILSFNDVDIAQFYGRIPEVSVELVADLTLTHADVMRDCLDRAVESTGISTEMTIGIDRPMHGYVIQDESTFVSAISPLAVIGGYDIVDDFGTYGKMKVINSYAHFDTKIPKSDYETVNATRNGGNESEGTYVLETVDNLSLPQTLKYSFIYRGGDAYNDSKDYQEYEVRSDVENTDSMGTKSISVQTTMNEYEAQFVVNRVYADMRSQNLSMTVRLPFRYAKISVGQVVGMEIEGEYFSFRVVKKVIGANYIIEVGLVYIDNVRSFFAIDASGNWYIPAPE